MHDRGGKVSLNNPVAGTLEFHRTEGIAKLLFVSMLHPGLFDFDKVLIKNDRRLTAETIVGQVALHGCYMSRHSINPYASEVTVRFLYATLDGKKVGDHDGRLRLTYFIDTSKMDMSVGTIHVDRDDWPKKLRVDVSGHVIASSKVDGDVLEIVRGPEYFHHQNSINIRLGLMLRCMWQSETGSEIWDDAYERATGIRSALVALVGHMPDLPLLNVHVEHEGKQSHIGKMLVCSDDEGIKDTPPKTHFLFDVSKHASELASIGANWVSRHRNNIKRFREAVHWAEWDAKLNRTTEHKIVNFVMAMETWSDDVHGNTVDRLSFVVGGDVFFKELEAIGLEGFKDVVEQVVWCRNFITHRRPAKRRSGNLPWDYEDDNVLHFVSVSAQFLFYVHALRLCGLDIEAWHKTNPHGHHPLVKYVREYPRNVRNARGTKLRPKDP